MVDFAAGQADVLVCTAIIENGMDLPNVNTLIADECWMFGLSQLYQLRGRVGRSVNQAYAYFLYSPERRLTEEGQKRMQAILEAREVLCIEIGRRKIGPGHPCFIIAEGGVNHNGDLDRARELVDVAADAGVDAVKFQTFRAEAVISPGAPQAAYQLQNTGRLESQLEMVRRLELGPDDTRALRNHCVDRGIMFLSTPFDEVSADLLEELDVPAFKVGSGELTNHRFLRHIAEKGRPFLLSTGMSNLEEVTAAVEAIRAAGNPALCLFHCVSDYPAAPEDCNLRAIGTLRRAYRCPIGWSDHTLGLHVTMAAVGLGAELVEKHFTLDRTLPGPDHKASIEPDELSELVRQIRNVEAALGDGVKRCQESEMNTAAVARRSAHTAKAIAAGKRIEADDLIAMRPGTGIPAERIGDLLGRRTLRDLAAGEMLSENDLE